VRRSTVGLGCLVWGPSSSPLALVLCPSSDSLNLIFRLVGWWGEVRGRPTLLSRGEAGVLAPFNPGATDNRVWISTGLPWSAETMHICMYVCMCMCMCVYVCIYVYVCICVYVYTCICICMCMCIMYVYRDQDGTMRYDFYYCFHVFSNWYVCVCVFFFRTLGP